MSTLSFTYTLTAGTAENVAHVQQDFTDVATWANGNVDQDNMTSSFLDKVGVTKSGTVRRGKTIIATEESRTNTAYGTLTTADQVSSVVLPTDGLIVVAYQAMWKESVNGAARAAIFIGSNQLVSAGANLATPGVQEAENPGAANTYQPLSSFHAGLAGAAEAGATAYTGHLTTGQVIGTYTATNGEAGGPCEFFAAAGTYDISIRFKSTSGSVTVKERKLWVKAEGY